jgi:hypothetical protein
VTKTLARGALWLPVGLLAAAMVAGQPNAWEVLATGWDQIMPRYDGQVAHLIDAIITFLIVFMTVFEVGKKSGKMPKSVAVGMGLMLWLPLVVFLNQTGRLLFQNAFVIIGGWLIAALWVFVITNGLINQARGEQGRALQKISVAAFAVMVTSVIFVPVLQTAVTHSQTEQMVVEAALSIAMVAGALLPLLVIFGLYKWFQLGGGDSFRMRRSSNRLSSKGRALDKAAGYVGDAIGNARTKRGHLKQMKRWAADQADFAQKYAENGGSLAKLDVWLQSVHGQLLRIQESLQKYRAWIEKNGELPQAYKDKLEVQANQWKQQLQGAAGRLVKESQDLHKRETGMKDFRLERIKVFEDPFQGHFKDVDRLLKQAEQAVDSFTHSLTWELRLRGKELSEVVDQHFKKVYEMVNEEKQVVDNNTKSMESAYKAFHDYIDREKPLEEAQPDLEAMQASEAKLENDLRHVESELKDIAEKVSWGLMHVTPQPVAEAITKLEATREQLRDDIKELQKIQETALRLRQKLSETDHKIQEAETLRDQVMGFAEKAVNSGRLIITGSSAMRQAVSLVERANNAKKRKVSSNEFANRISEFEKWFTRDIQSDLRSLDHSGERGRQLSVQIGEMAKHVLDSLKEEIAELKKQEANLS